MEKKIICNYPTPDNFPNPTHLSYPPPSMSKMNAASSRSANGLFFTSLPLAPLTDGRTAETSGDSSRYHFTGWKVTASPGTNAGRHNWTWPAAKQLPGATVDCSCHQVELAAVKYGPEERGSRMRLRGDSLFTLTPLQQFCS